MAVTKEHILVEIRRLAVENGGVAPGTKAFIRATGIKESDWRGRYWINWGHALQEAGYQPNSWVTGAPEDTLLCQLAMDARALGHYPVDSELKIARHNGTEVPSPLVLRRRFGSAQATADALLRYARSENDAALASICEARLKLETPRAARAASPVSISGCVYLMKSGQFYKIGLSNSSGRRGYEIGIQLPEHLKLVHEIKTDSPAALEAYWHDRFAAKRKNGEWFDLDAADIKAFTRRKRFFFAEVFC